MKQRNYFNSDITQNAKRACNIQHTYQQGLKFKRIFQFLAFKIQSSTSNIVYQLAGLVQVLQAVQFSLWFSIIRWNLYLGPFLLIGLNWQCERDYFIKRSNNICVPDKRIKSLISYFESTTFSAISSFQFVQDSTNLRSYPSLIFDCSSTKFVGSLLYSEGMSFQFENSQSLQFIRLKISFYNKSFQTYNKIQIRLDDQIQGEIIKTSYNYTFDKITKIIVRVSLGLILMMQSGQRQYQEFILMILYLFQKENNQLLGFRNTIIDSDNLKRNFAVCGDFSTYQKCNTNYLLFQNGCVSTCPVHSSNCVNYSNTIANLFLDSCYLFSKRVIQFKYEYFKIKILPYPFLFIIDEVIESNEKITIKINNNPIIELILLKISNGESKL
ncbi:unnamed protein product [Paramecium primaurelia]|uniref:Uncharacterized protein n=1 Tax=Paramecium primaurelia TaxID=5886 RepID=A0A8S1QTF2_PARPR|nr:unnamed protein product [Paramecium primaurelia]